MSNNEQLSERLVEFLPELANWYQLLLAQYGEDEDQPGDHTVYGNLLEIYLDILIQCGDDQGALRRAFDLLEVLAQGDRHARDVVITTVLKHLASQGLLGVIWNQIGPTTRVLALEVIMPIRVNSPEQGLTYDELWRRSLGSLGGPETVAIEQALRVRAEVSRELGLPVFPGNELFDPFSSFNFDDYKKRFREVAGDCSKLLQVSEINQIYELAENLRLIRLNLFSEFGLIGS